MSDERLKRLLNEARLEGEDEARERSRRVVRAAYAERSASRRPLVTARRLALSLAAIGALLALVLTPAGAKVVSAVRDAAGIGAKHARPELTSLPAPGSLVVDSPLGPWVVSGDGSKRLLGDYREATWSPHGLYLAVARPDQLAAVTPSGELRWTIDGGAISDPRWSPSGSRVTYRSGRGLWLAAGDASFHERIVGSVAPVAPAWRPIAHPTPAPIQYGPRVNVVAYVDGHDRVVVLNTDTNEVLWTSGVEPRPSELVWSSDGRQLVAVTRHAFYTYRGDGSPTVARVARDQTIRFAAALPGSHRIVASISTGPPGRLSVTPTASRRLRRLTGIGGAQGIIIVGRPGAKLFSGRTLFQAPGPLGDIIPAADGSAILVTWPAADQWLFLRPDGHRLPAVGGISRLFDPKASGPVAFPHVESWCCAAPPATN